MHGYRVAGSIILADQSDRGNMSTCINTFLFIMSLSISKVNTNKSGVMKALLIDKYGISKESIDYTTYALGDGYQTLLNSCDIHISPGER